MQGYNGSRSVYQISGRDSPRPCLGVCRCGPRPHGESQRQLLIRTPGLPGSRASGSPPAYHTSTTTTTLLLTTNLHHHLPTHGTRTNPGDPKGLQGTSGARAGMLSLQGATLTYVSIYVYIDIERSTYEPRSPPMEDPAGHRDHNPAPPGPPHPDPAQKLPKQAFAVQPRGLNSSFRLKLGPGPLPTAPARKGCINHMTLAQETDSKGVS